MNDDNFEFPNMYYTGGLHGMGANLTPLESEVSLVRRESEKPKMKQVIVIRTDLNMRKGKQISQGAHAAMLFICKRLEFRGTHACTDGSLTLQAEFNAEELEWVKGAFTKVVVGGDSEESLRALYAQAIEAGLEAHLMIDNGETEFGNVPTLTALAIGPARADRINLITGHLKLL